MKIPYFKKGLIALVIFMVLIPITAANECSPWTPEGEWSSFAEYNGNVYFGGSGGKLFRVNPESGSIDNNWYYPSGDEGLGAIYSTPIIGDDGMIYSTAYNCTGTGCSGFIFALSPQCSESLIHQQCNRIIEPVNARLIGQPALYENLLLVGVDQPRTTSETTGYLYALDFQTQNSLERVRWRLPIGKVWSGIEVVNDIAYFGTYSGMLYAVDLAIDSKYDSDPMSRVLWSFDTDGIIVAKPVIKDGKIYLGALSSEPDVFVLDINTRLQSNTGSYDSLNTAANEWSFTTGSGVWASIVLYEDVAYVSTMRGEIYALDTVTGSQLWLNPVSIGSPIVGVPTLIESESTSFLAVPSFENGVHVVTLPSGLYEKRIYKTDSGVASSPSLIDGLLYVHALDGKIVIFDPFTLNEKGCFQGFENNQVELC